MQGFERIISAEHLMKRRLMQMVCFTPQHVISALAAQTKQPMTPVISIIVYFKSTQHVRIEKQTFCSLFYQPVSKQ